MKVRQQTTKVAEKPTKWAKPMKSKAKLSKSTAIPFHMLLRASWKYQGKIFFAESTLHGVRYIAESDRPIIERLMWFVCVLIGAISTMVIIVSLWEKFQTNPTITGLDTDFHNWDIPFPAVTICPNKPWNEERFAQYLEIVKEKYRITTSESEEQLRELLLSLSEMSLSKFESFAAAIKDFNVSLNEDLKQNIFKIMNTCDELLSACEWKAAAYNCCLGFFPVFTENGFCYTFNGRHYEPLAASDDTPYPEYNLEYIKETDVKWSLKFILPEKNYTDFNISIYLHTSDEIPGVDMKPHHQWTFLVERLQFSMRETYTTANAKQLTVKQRHCIFDDEQPLKIDHMYTYSACTQQCRMEAAQRICNCVPHFYHIPTDGQDIYRHCTLAELRCIADNLAPIRGASCDCKLGCSNTIYEVDKLNEKKNDNGIPLTDEESFECEFTTWPMIKYKREVLFGWVDLLVSFGGIAGLFLGFSLLSGVEIIYYFTIRTCCMMYKQRDDLMQIVANPKGDAIKKKEIEATAAPYFIRPPSRQQLMPERHKPIFNYKIAPLKVKPMQPKNRVIVPPFGIDYVD